MRVGVMVASCGWWDMPCRWCRQYYRQWHRDMTPNGVIVCLINGLGQNCASMVGLLFHIQEVSREFRASDEMGDKLHACPHVYFIIVVQISNGREL